MEKYKYAFFTVRTALMKALEHLQKGNLKAAEEYLREGLRLSDEEVAREREAAPPRP